MQSESFEGECKALGGDEPIKCKSRIAGLSPFVGPAGLLRSQSRLRRLGIADYDAKHPVILDSKHPLVKLMLQWYHKRFHHMGPDYIRAQVNCKYIALGARSVLRSIAQRCVVCRKRDSSVINPLMVDLPKERLGYMQPPFANCGVDYFGLFFVTVRRSTEKRWAFLFTCLTTRAIHLEVVPSLDTSSCVAGIERFIARRGTPSIFWSDNGTNFVGAEKELIEAVTAWNERAPSALVRLDVKWKFNPPSAPHHGGPWEIMAKSSKRVFYAILGTRRLTDETLTTTLCLVEQALNARPLTPVTDNPDDLEALTPNHFLLGCPAASLPSSVSDGTPNPRKRYTQAQAYANQIWTRWLKVYVPSLHKRTKWNTPSPYELKTGDLVWLVDSASPRGYYPLGRVGLYIMERTL